MVNESSLLNRELNINIRLKPRRLAKGLVLLLLLVVVFYLGRFTAGPEEALTSANVVEESNVGSEEALSESKEESLTSKATEFVTGLVSGLLPEFSEDSEEDVSAPDTNAASETSTADTATNTNSTAEALPETEAAALANDSTSTPEQTAAAETVVTTYGKVALALNNVLFDWKGDWGKITKIDYIIKNNEEGTIKPSYLIMLVEGYDTEETMIKKKISLPLSGQSLGAAGTYTQITNVPQGFAYNEITAGDLADVRIALSLYDASDKLMSSYSKGFDLRGPATT